MREKYQKAARSNVDADGFKYTAYYERQKVIVIFVVFGPLSYRFYLSRPDNSTETKDHFRFDLLFDIHFFTSVMKTQISRHTA